MVEKKIAPKKSRIKNTKLGNSWEPPKYLQSLIASINEGARAAQGGLFLMLFVCLYVLATSVSTTDEDLFLGRSVNISQIGVALPVSVSLAIAPMILVFFHLYTLTRYALLAANLRHFKEHLGPLAPDERENCQHLLSNVEFVVSFIESKRTPIFNSPWRRLSLLLLAVLPVTTLLMIQISSLRYQSGIILSVQRMVLLVDLIGLVWFFHNDPWGDKVCPKLLPDSRWALLAERFPKVDWTFTRYWMRLVWFPVLIFAFNLAYLSNAPADADAGSVRFETFFGKKFEFLEVNAGPIPWALLPEWVNPDFQSIGRVGRAKFITGWALIIASQPLDHLLCPWLNWGCRYLHVERQTLISKEWDPNAVARIREGNSDSSKNIKIIDGVQLRSRNFRFAALRGIRLYGADLFEADLRKADLTRAHLRGTVLRETKLQEVNLTLAQLQGANLYAANLNGANLVGTSFVNADLYGAQLKGSDLMLAQLQGADLVDARLQGANLSLAQMQSAKLSGANLQGTILSSAGLEGTNLTGAKLQGVYIADADLVATILDKAETWRVGWGDIENEPHILYPAGEIQNIELNQEELQNVKNEALQGLSDKISTIVAKRLRHLLEGWENSQDNQFEQTLNHARTLNGKGSPEQRSNYLGRFACGHINSTLKRIRSEELPFIEGLINGIIKLHADLEDITSENVKDIEKEKLEYSRSIFAKTILSLKKDGQCPYEGSFSSESLKMIETWTKAEN
ncbi:MAG: pentapeptide repeat-containing protein [Deltaproteobacteria bacterium]|nr:pentapeptide repeat-containing protein [Deltaproteobacteria bacterium]